MTLNAYWDKSCDDASSPTLPQTFQTFQHFPTNLIPHHQINMSGERKWSPKDDEVDEEEEENTLVSPSALFGRGPELTSFAVISIPQRCYSLRDPRAQLSSFKLVGAIFAEPGRDN